MTIQNLINKATNMQIMCAPIYGQLKSRSGIVKTSKNQVQPYTIKFSVAPCIYSQNRDLVASVTNIDINTVEVISLSNNSGMSYITDYKGGVTANLDTITILSYPEQSSGYTVHGDALVVNANTCTPTGVALFQQGDFIQPLGNANNYAYPYQIAFDNYTPTVTASGGQAIVLNRPIIEQANSNIINYGMKVGSDVTFRVKLMKPISYTISPHDVLTFDSEIELMEVITV